MGWNDFLIALIFLGQTNEVVTVNLAQLLGRLGEGWQLLTAGAFITMTLPLIVFFGLQRYFAPVRRLVRFPAPVGLG